MKPTTTRKQLTLLHRISGLGVPAAKHEKDTDPPIFLMYSALGLFSNVGGSLMMTWIGGDLPSLPRLLKGWHWYWPSCSGPTCNVNIDVLKYYFSKYVAGGPELYFSKYIIVCVPLVRLLLASFSLQILGTRRRRPEKEAFDYMAHRWKPRVIILCTQCNLHL